MYSYVDSFIFLMFRISFQAKEDFKRSNLFVTNFANFFTLIDHIYGCCIKHRSIMIVQLYVFI